MGFHGFHWFSFILYLFSFVFKFVFFGFHWVSFVFFDIPFGNFHVFSLFLLACVCFQCVRTIFPLVCIVSNCTAFVSHWVSLVLHWFIIGCSSDLHCFSLPLICSWLAYHGFYLLLIGFPLVSHCFSFVFRWRFIAFHLFLILSPSGFIGFHLFLLCFGFVFIFFQWAFNFPFVSIGLTWPCIGFHWFIVVCICASVISLVLIIFSLSSIGCPLAFVCLSLYARSFHWPYSFSFFFHAFVISSHCFSNGVS